MKKRKITATGIFGLFAILCLVYMLTIRFAMGFGTRFYLIWGVMAIGFCVLSLLCAHRQWLDRIPGWFRRTCMILFTTGILLFMIVEGLILTQFAAKPQPGADYCIILGAQWKTNGPSYVLQKRLDKAIVYLKDNPDTNVIVSGGQGTNEPISEAEGMAGYLIEAGIDENRIILENQSVNTFENLTFSSKYLNKEQDNVVIVTNNFHQFRALAIAKKQGYSKVQGLAAGSYPGMVPNNMLREFFGVLKDFLTGNM